MRPATRICEARIADEYAVQLRGKGIVLPDSRNRNGIITAMEKSQGKGKNQIGVCVGVGGWVCDVRVVMLVGLLVQALPVNNAFLISLKRGKKCG